MASIDELKSVATSKLGFARANQFLVEMPTIGQGGFLSGFLSNFLPPLPSIPGILDTGAPSTREMNLLCSNTTLPGKSILTTERRFGMKFDKVGYSYAVDDISMTFYCMNDYGIKKYLDSWISTILNEETGEIAYKSDYAKSIKIHQLRKPLVGFSKNLGPLRGSLQLGGGSVYTVELLEAFPTNVQGINLSNELDGLVQVTATFSYTRWKPVEAGLQNFIQGSLNFG